MIKFIGRLLVKLFSFKKCKVYLEISQVVGDVEVRAECLPELRVRIHDVKEILFRD